MTKAFPPITNELPPRSARVRRHGLRKLSPREVSFIDEYMVDRNAFRAAMRAGYGSEATCRVVGYKMLNRREIQEEIDRRDKERAARVGVRADDILMELKRMAFFDIRKLFDPATGRLICNPNELSEDEARALINFDIIVVSKTGEYVVKLNPGNKLKALELLGKHLKLFTDKVEHSGTVVEYQGDFGD